MNTATFQEIHAVASGSRWAGAFMNRRDARGRSAARVGTSGGSKFATPSAALRQNSLRSEPKADAIVADPPYAETGLQWDQWAEGWPALIIVPGKQGGAPLASSFARINASASWSGCRKANCLALERRWRLAWIASGAAPKALRDGEADRRRWP